MSRVPRFRHVEWSRVNGSPRLALFRLHLAVAVPQRGPSVPPGWRARAALVAGVSAAPKASARRHCPSPGVLLLISTPALKFPGVFVTGLSEAELHLDCVKPQKLQTVRAGEWRGRKPGDRLDSCLSLHLRCCVVHGPCVLI